MRKKYLILKITNRCNLDCIYCYNMGHKINKNMDFTTAKNSIDYILNDGTELLKIQFTGGEPLLNFELIEKVISYCKKEYKTKNISYAVQTNGTLLNNELIKKIKELNIKIGISIDGMDINDTLRPYKNGRPSTLDTLKGIYLLKNNSVPFGITTVITNKNLPHMVEFIQYLIALGIKSISFDLLKPKQKEHLNLMPNEEEFNKILKELKNYPIYIKNLQKRPKGKYCFLNTGDLLFVNEFGDIYPCPTMEGYFYMGNINKDNENNIKKNIKKFEVKNNKCFAREYLIKKF
ncbi:Radical SAM domain protein [Methanococcus aeolicus Nankai-3]|uniref:Radical SAM domain protein n=1 Tax=Methanococcus aeolicus (strain ATCC BAA-1280 / DSM 17508 / OCM 812 / Nankai-3) TaxID=419665 RepID=A6UT75_META3|nr:radical SAM protein [Methanococcus aeolicus]ABR55697.1 Radical SAM domain protein [Methanococcus aeolicus Nankai-3]